MKLINRLIVGGSLVITSFGISCLDANGDKTAEIIKAIKDNTINYDNLINDVEFRQICQTEDLQKSFKDSIRKACKTEEEKDEYDKLNCLMDLILKSGAYFDEIYTALKKNTLFEVIKGKQERITLLKNAEEILENQLSLLSAKDQEDKYKEISNRKNEVSSYINELYEAIAVIKDTWLANSDWIRKNISKEAYRSIKLFGESGAYFDEIYTTLKKNTLFEVIKDKKKQIPLSINMKENLEHQLSPLSTSLVKNSKSIKKLKNKIEDLKNERGKVLSQKNDLEQQIKSKEIDPEHQLSSLKDSKSIEKLKDKIKDLKNEMEKVLSQENDLEQQIKSKETELASLMEKRKPIEDKYNEIRNRKDKVSRYINELYTSLAVIRNTWLDNRDLVRKNISEEAYRSIELFGKLKYIIIEKDFLDVLFRNGDTYLELSQNENFKEFINIDKNWQKIIQVLLEVDWLTSEEREARINCITEASESFAKIYTALKGNTLLEVLKEKSKDQRKAFQEWIKESSVSKWLNSFCKSETKHYIRLFNIKDKFSNEIINFTDIIIDNDFLKVLFDKDFSFLATLRSDDIYQDSKEEWQLKFINFIKNENLRDKTILALEKSNWLTPEQRNDRIAWIKSIPYRNVLENPLKDLRNLRKLKKNLISLRILKDIKQKFESDLADNPQGIYEWQLKLNEFKKTTITKIKAFENELKNLEKFKLENVEEKLENVEEKLGNLQNFLEDRNILFWLEKNIPTKNYREIELLKKLGNIIIDNDFLDILFEENADYTTLENNEEFLYLIKDKKNLEKITNTLERVEWLSKDSSVEGLSQGAERSNWIIDLVLRAHPYYDEIYNALKENTLLQVIKDSESKTRKALKEIVKNVWEPHWFWVRRNISERASRCIKLIKNLDDVIIDNNFLEILFEENADYTTLENNKEFPEFIKTEENWQKIIYELLGYFQEDELNKRIDFLQKVSPSFQEVYKALKDKTLLKLLNGKEKEQRASFREWVQKDRIWKWIKFNVLGEWRKKDISEDPYFYVELVKNIESDIIIENNFLDALFKISVRTHIYEDLQNNENFKKFIKENYSQIIDILEKSNSWKDYGELYSATERIDWLKKLNISIQKASK